MLMNTFDAICSSVVVLGLLALLAQFLTMRNLYSKLENREDLPDVIKEFPVLEVEAMNYEDLKNTINFYFKSALDDQVVTLQLDENQINLLVGKGTNGDIYTPGLHVYFSVENHIIVEKLLEYPNMIGKDGIRTRTRLVSFQQKEAKVFSSYQVIEEYGRRINEPPLILPLTVSPLVLFILDASQSPLYFDIDWRTSTKYQDKLKLLKKVTRIEVLSNSLYIEFNRQ